MRWAFHYRKPFTRQLALVDAFAVGAKKRGHKVQPVQGFDRVEDTDGLILFGIGGNSRDVFDAYTQAGKAVVFLDKGYTTRASMFRVAVNAFQPVDFVAHARKPADRWAALGIELKPYRVNRGGYALFDGASNKFCLWHRMPYWEEWGRSMVAKIESAYGGPVKYRPRPSHNIRETLPPLVDDMAGAFVVVSYGGNIGFDCVVGGVPHFAIGDSVARPLSETDWSRVNVARVPSDSERLQWCANVAYCQWSLAEIEAGAIWSHIEEQLC